MNEQVTPQAPEQTFEQQVERAQEVGQQIDATPDAPEQPQNLVPQPALHEERKRRQELQRELSETRAQQMALQQQQIAMMQYMQGLSQPPPPPPPDPAVTLPMRSAIVPRHTKRNAGVGSFATRVGTLYEKTQSLGTSAAWCTVGSLSSNNIGHYYLGCDANATGSFLTGDIAEIIVYNDALTTARRESVVAYLRAKWAL